MDPEKLRRPPELKLPPKRVISLVPSLTETLFDLGFGNAVTGITDYCIHPASQLSGKVRIGSVREPDIQQIIAQKPDLVIANREENSPDTIHKLEENSIPVWLTFPQSVDQVVSLFYDLLAVFHSDQSALKIKTILAALDWTRSLYSRRPVTRYFCPLWQGEENGVRWWMTFNRETYSNDLLDVFGGVNTFADRERIYPLQADLGLAKQEEPGKRDTRYPRVTLDEIRRANPELILLPSEPFNYSHQNLEEFKVLCKDTQAVQQNRIHLVDGTLITWYGTRLAKALQDLPQYFERV